MAGACGRFDVSMIHRAHQQIGIIGLEEIFRGWRKQKKPPIDLIDKIIIETITSCNHVEKEYGKRICRCDQRGIVPTVHRKLKY